MSATGTKAVTFWSAPASSPPTTIPRLSTTAYAHSRRESLKSRGGSSGGIAGGGGAPGAAAAWRGGWKGRQSARKSDDHTRRSSPRAART